MAAGTIAVTNGSKSVVGSGTSFTTDLKPNDFFYFDIGETTYMVVVDTITSDTQMTMLKSFSGATSDGISWGVVPRKGLAMIAAQSVKDMAEYMRSSVLDKVNWQGVFTEPDQVTVTLIDGSQFTGSSWKKITDQLNAIDIDSVTAIADQVRSDAQQVSDDKNTLTPLMSQARTDAQQIADDKDTITQAKTDAVQAKTDAVAAKEAAEQAAANVPSIDNVRALIDAICPIGMRIDWPSETLPDNETYGVKFLVLNGLSYDKEKYPKLYAILGTDVLPEQRGAGVRGWDNGRGIDASRTLLSEQLDAAPNISGTSVFSVFGDRRSGSGGSPFTLNGNSSFSVTTSSSSSHTAGTLSFDASTVSAAYGRNSATEVRMRNVAWNMIVRAS